jgi:hypothetical protein
LGGTPFERSTEVTADFLPIALRAYTERIKEPQLTKNAKREPSSKRSSVALIFDTETTVDRSQRLLFGSYRLVDLQTGEQFEEGFFHEDRLQETDPSGSERLQRYVATHEPQTVRWHSRWIRLMSAREFLDKVLWTVAELDGLIVGFNLPFDLSRLALGWSDARRHYRGGFSFHFWKFKDRKTGKHRPSWYRPLIRIKHLDSKRSFIRFTQPRRERDNRAQGAFLESHFLDLRMLAFALTSAGHTLESACRAFGVEHGKVKASAHGVITDEYIGYNRRDVLATKELLFKLLEEFDRHPIALDPCKAYSPAAISKAYLKAMGITPPSKKFANVSKQILGRAMTAYYGGRAECRIRNVIVPLSMSIFSRCTQP